MALWELQQELYHYMFQRLVVANSEGNNKRQNVFLNIQDYFTITRLTHTEKSEILYLEVMDAVAGKKDTIMQILHDLHQRYIVDEKQKWLVVEGDQKIYD